MSDEESGATVAKKNRDERAERVARAILDEYQPKTADEAQDALRSVFGPMIESMLQGELDAHLGYKSNDKGPKETANRRNGYSKKSVKTSFGKVPIEVPRDRDCTFEPVVVAKGEGDLSDIEAKVLSLYARGLSMRDIADVTREIYGFSISAETVSAITERIRGELGEWQSRPLEPIYAFLFVDCMFVTVRGREGAAKHAVYTVLAYTMEGRKDILGMWMSDSEGAHFWMGVFGELRARGVEDVLFVSIDGLSGLEEGVGAVFPKATVQRCVVHLVRDARKFVPHCEATAFCRDCRGLYNAPSLQEARARFEAFKSDWQRYPGATGVFERSWRHVEQLYAHGPDVRRIMYTTNAIESVNSSFRKVVKKGAYPTEDAVLKLLYLRVRELDRKWGNTGEVRCRPAGWSKVLCQLYCVDGFKERIERLWVKE